MEERFSRTWDRLPLWSRAVFLIIGTSLFLLALGNAMTSETEKEIRRCTSELSKASGGGMPINVLRQKCTEIQLRGN